MSKLVYTSQRGKTKKKPGWKQAQAEHDAWLARVNSMTLFDPAARPRVKAGPKIDVVVRGPIERSSPLDNAPSVSTPGGIAGKDVHRPEIVYADRPDLLERELKARQRKFAVAPAYNKGGDVLVTDELMKDIAAGGTRRRG